MGLGLRIVVGLAALLCGCSSDDKVGADAQRPVDALTTTDASADAAELGTDATRANGDANTSGGGPDGNAMSCGPLDDVLRINHIQVKGTHNSYHLEPDIVLHGSHAYSHAPLNEQLDVQGVRAFELDIHRDSAGSTDLSVYHLAFIDAKTTCSAFTDCLSTVKAWSDNNPCHVPILIWIEPKDDAGGVSIGDLQIVDDAILSVFGPAQLITPDDVRGSRANLREAIDLDGWPTLGQSRGKVMFMLLDSGGHRSGYLASGTLAGRVMFVDTNADELGEPWAGVAKINNPASADIAPALAADILVASNVCAADQSDSSCGDNLTAGLDNGVHMLKDDIPWPVSSRSYSSVIPGGNPARCNPVTAPPSCTAVAIEDL